MTKIAENDKSGKIYSLYTTKNVKVRRSAPGPDPGAERREGAAGQRVFLSCTEKFINF